MVTAVVIPSGNFRFYSEDNIFIAEMSDLKEFIGDTLPACFYIKSAKTGSLVLFVMASVDRDREGEAQGFRYRDSEGLTQCRALLIND